MANYMVKQPLLSCPGDPTGFMSGNSCKFKRRYKRFKSAPVGDITTGENLRALTSPLSQSILHKVHPNLWKVSVALAVYLAIGTCCFYLARDQIKGYKPYGALDALYLCVVTMTTVGYGDLVPDSVTTKLFACAFVFSGMALVGMILNKAADYLVEKQESLVIRALHAHQKLRMTDSVREIETNQAKYKLLIVILALVVLIIAGVVFLSMVERLSLVDSFYSVCSTITTLGYGDKSFLTFEGRIFAVFWILTSTICMAQFFFYMAELNTEHKQHVLAKWVLTRKMTLVDLEAADFDEDGVVSASEFVIYKLKEMGKINEQDVAIIMEEFEKLDVDQSGFLPLYDIEERFR